MGLLFKLLLSCRGYKTVVKAFSSEVADLEPVLALLLRCNAQVSTQVAHIWCHPAACVHCKCAKE